MIALETAQLEQVLSKATKFVEENPAAVGVSAVATLLTGFRRAELKRDGKDFNSSVTGGLRIFNNNDHTLKGNEFETS